MTTALPSRRVLPHPARDEIRLESVLHALSDPVRMRIVSELADAEAALSCSYFDLPVTKSTTTHHFRVLRESGVIQQVYEGTAKMNGLRRGATWTPCSPASSTPPRRGAPAGGAGRTVLTCRPARSGGVVGGGDAEALPQPGEVRVR